MTPLPHRPPSLQSSAWTWKPSRPDSLMLCGSESLAVKRTIIVEVSVTPAASRFAWEMS